MRKLLKKDAKFVWTDDCEKELQDLKQALINNPFLQPLQPDRVVFIYADASTLGLASVTIQYDDNNKPHVCSY